MEEFDYVSSAMTEMTKSTNVDPRDVWLCDQEQSSVRSDEEHIRRAIADDAYIPLPFPKDTIDPYEWSHILITLDTRFTQANVVL